MEQEADVCFMTDQMHFFTYSNMLVWEDWTYGGHSQGEWQLIPGTLMMYKDTRFAYPAQGPDAHKGEDSTFLRAFYNEKRIARLSGAGPLYLYTCHGRNTFDIDHHEGQRNTSFPLQFVQAQEQYLKPLIGQYQINRPCAVATREGTAFSI
jgi:hypothetical protein